MTMRRNRAPGVAEPHAPFTVLHIPHASVTIDEPQYIQNRSHRYPVSWHAVAPGVSPGMTPAANEMGPRVPQLTDTALRPGRITPACVAGFVRNGWPDSIGTGGRIPPEYAVCEAFNGSLRRACLTRHWFASLREAQTELSTWRADYNNLRSHTSLGVCKSQLKNERR